MSFQNGGGFDWRNPAIWSKKLEKKTGKAREQPKRGINASAEGGSSLIGSGGRQTSRRENSRWKKKEKGAKEGGGISGRKERLPPTKGRTAGGS